MLFANYTVISFWKLINASEKIFIEHSPLVCVVVDQMSQSICSHPLLSTIEYQQVMIRLRGLWDQSLSTHRLQILCIRFNKKYCLHPVSYTHLDVYKRQVL